MRSFGAYTLSGFSKAHSMKQRLLIAAIAMIGMLIGSFIDKCSAANPSIDSNAAQNIAPSFDYHPLRSPAARSEFRKDNPCPVTGNTQGLCRGFVVDHVRPLCAGGRDQPSNMQWQTIDQARIKDHRAAP
jgi:hypothetical protein